MNLSLSSAFIRSLVSMRFCSERATGYRSISYSR
jgi:hypothetical protein